LKGAGHSKVRAYRNAFRQLNSNDLQLSKFMKDGKQIIHDYVSTNCNELIRLASNKLKYNQVLTDVSKDVGYSNSKIEAVGVLLNLVNASTPCADEAQKTIESVYDQLSSEQCRVMINTAKAALANDDFSDAVDILMMIPANSVCQSELDALIQKLETEQKDNMEYERLIEFTKLENEHELSKMDVMERISGKYFENMWPEMNDRSITLIK